MKRKTLHLGILIAASLIALDQITKALIRMFVDEGDEGAIVLIPSFLQINHHWNEGAAWGMLPGAIGFFIAITLVALGVFGYLFWDADFQKKTTLFHRRHLAHRRHPRQLHRPFGLCRGARFHRFCHSHRALRFSDF